MADSGDEDLPLEREFVKPQQALAHLTAAPVASKKASQPFNPSGAVGVVVEPALALPVASTSAAPPAASTPSAPAPLAVGSALASGATVTVVKRAPKQRGRMRQLVTAVGKGKGKAKAVEEEEEESDFDSSEATSGEDDDEEEDSAGEDGNEEEWKGIDGEAEEAAAASSHSASDGEGGSGDDGSEMSDEEHSDEEAEEADDAPKRPPRERGAFRAWADEQVLKASGQEADTSAQPAEVDDGTYKPLLPAGSGFKNKVDPNGITGPLGAVIPKSELPSLPPQRTVHIAVTRTPEIEASRAELPVVKEEDRVMEVIRGHPVVVLCGETGSGKTTQIGQFLWEAGFGDPSSGAFCILRRHQLPLTLFHADNPGMVAITQPRRVAALSTSARVRTELGLADDSSLVAHRIRYSSTSAADTKLVLMTDGVLLRELAADFLLTKYSVVVVDEAHERGVNTDVLIGVLSRVAKLREKQWRSGKEGAKVRQPV